MGRMKSWVAILAVAVWAGCAAPGPSRTVEAPMPQVEYQK